MRGWSDKEAGDAASGPVAEMPGWLTGLTVWSVALTHSFPGGIMKKHSWAWLLYSCHLLVRGYQLERWESRRWSQDLFPTAAAFSFYVFEHDFFLFFFFNSCYFYSKIFLQLSVCHLRVLWCPYPAPTAVLPAFPSSLGSLSIPPSRSSFSFTSYLGDHVAALTASNPSALPLHQPSVYSLHLPGAYPDTLQNP